VFTHPYTDHSFVSIYLSRHPCSRLIVCRPHTSLESVHFISLHRHRSILSPLLWFILIYTQYFVISTLTHIVFAPTLLPVSSNFLHTMLLFPLLVSPSSGTICFCTGSVFYRYLRNLLDSCWKRNHEYAGPQSKSKYRVHVGTSVERHLSTLKRGGGQKHFRA
jgi:hypothetical protein